MKKITVRQSLDLQPATSLWQMYQPDQARYRFTAADIGSAQEWQQLVHPALAERIGLNVIPSAEPEAIVLEEIDKKDYLRQKLLLRTGPDCVMPVYLLLPKNVSGKMPTVLAFHGHGYGVKDIVGLWEDGSERENPDGYHKHFAIELCRAGFAVAAPEISCFGERRTDFSHLQKFPPKPVPSTCQHTALLAFHMGISALGLRVHDGLRLVDYLQTRPELDCARLGAMGISGGGMHTFFSTCIDPRIRACVISGYYSTFRDSILDMHHCTCNFVPGLAEFGEMHDVAGLIAPRPILIESGSHDPIFPRASVRAGVTKLKQVYDVFNARDRVRTDYFEGRHQISGRKAYAFLRDNLGNCSK